MVRTVLESEALIKTSQANSFFVWKAVATQLILIPPLIFNSICIIVKISQILDWESPLASSILVSLVFSYSLAIALVQRTLLAYFVQLHVDLFTESGNGITTKPSNNHRPQIGDVGRFPECGDSPSDTILKNRAIYYRNLEKLKCRKNNGKEKT